VTVRWRTSDVAFLLGVICVLIALASDTVWALIAGTARTWFERSPRRLRAIGPARERSWWAQVFALCPAALTEARRDQLTLPGRTVSGR
jgi:hypothetical protein